MNNGENMLCEICGKNPATIHIQEIINSKKKILHICKECANKKEAAKEMLSGLDLAQFMFNISSEASIDVGANPNIKITVPPDIKCPGCGWNFIQFTSTGRLSCPACFKTFRPVLDQAIKNMHKGCMHVGKRPISSSNKDDKTDKLKNTSKRIDELQKKLEDYVNKEEYEKAAQIRDLINDLKKELISTKSNGGKIDKRESN